jgi:hypothetical protein
MKRSGLLAAAIVVVVLFSLRQDLGRSPNSAETTKQLNLFGQGVRTRTRRLCRGRPAAPLWSIGDQRNADLARPAFELSDTRL